MRKKTSPEGFAWRCLNNLCCDYRNHVSIRQNSWLNEFNVSCKKIFMILYMYSAGLQVCDILKVVNVSKSTAQKLIAHIEPKIVDHIDNNFPMLGGQGIVVQIDETKLNFNVKSHRGRGPTTQSWALCICDTSYTPARGFVVPVNNRSTNTILPIIRSKVRPGSIIVTDEWRSYNRLSLQGYMHQTVCHRYNFVDPESGVHTQHVESWNNKLKLLIKSM